MSTIDYFRQNSPPKNCYSLIVSLQLRFVSLPLKMFLNVMSFEELAFGLRMISTVAVG